MKPFFLFSVAALLLLASRLPAQTGFLASRQLTGRPVQYQLAEWQLVLRAPFSNPYLQEQVRVDMLLTSPSGKKLVLPCYFESGDSLKSAWKARFLPQERGRYRYCFVLKTPAGKQESPPAHFSAKGGRGKGILHAGNHWTFRYDNGQLYRGLGENICWESRDHDDSRFFKTLHEDKKYNYEYMLPALARHGGDYFRTWICSWNLPIDWQSGFNNSRYTPSAAYFNPSAVQKLDRLVQLSDSLGLHMMLTLGAGTHDERNGRHPATMHGFFTDAKAREQYKNRLRFIVARWGFSPAIGAWEFFNEIDNIQFRDKDNPIPAADIVKWHGEMSTYLRSLDPYRHLITTSISHRDLEGLNSLPDIDFNQKHIYRNNRALPAAIVDYGKRFGKPYVIGEYGYEYDWQKNFDLFASEMDSDFKRGLWYGLFSPTPVLPLSWWWEYFENRDTDKYLANVRAVRDEMMQAGRGAFRTVEVNNSGAGLEVFAVACGKRTFVYVYNPGKTDRIANLQFATLQSFRKLSLYDCEQGSRRKLPRQRAGSTLNGIPVAAGGDIVLVF
ncbi:glycoside hydrolase [Pedobacter yulinensis]|uniref:Glycoside hydrolase n=2 Tax=Pedobacter yulinensis TaxID=2126353 RepID=A0A2T3HMT2_9SPHI|nr:glycoside hydrolase [Pedobacter yulinensis]